MYPKLMVQVNENGILAIAADANPTGGSFKPLNWPRPQRVVRDLVDIYEEWFAGRHPTTLTMSRHDVIVLVKAQLGRFS